MASPGWNESLGHDLGWAQHQYAAFLRCFRLPREASKLPENLPCRSEPAEFLHQDAQPI
jgi:hypothetical protein